MKKLRGPRHGRRARHYGRSTRPAHRRNALLRVDGVFDDAVDAATVNRKRLSRDVESFFLRALGAR
ncbi:MAG TPA: hypothetical protein VHC69_06655 [Polyangiaceae bacterium]|nr:hypothetical protein [Polyangiaceae bacterium]